MTLWKIVHRVASSYIAGRIQAVLPQLINVGRKGFLKGRYTGGNIEWLYGTLLYASKHHVPGLVLMLVFEKAFHSVALSFTELSLTVDFGHAIKRWISTVYANKESRMAVLGQYSIVSIQCLVFLSCGSSGFLH